MRTNTDILLDLFRGIPAERLLWIADLTWWRDARIENHQLPDRYYGESGFQRLHADLGVMPYYIYSTEEEDDGQAGAAVFQVEGAKKPYSGVWRMRYDGVDIETRRSGDVLETVYHAEGMSLVQRKRYLKESACYAFLEYPVKSAADLPALKRIVEGWRFEADSTDFLRLSGSWAGAGLPAAMAPRSPLSSLMVDWMGVENFIFTFLDHPEPIREILSCMDRANDRAFEIMLDSDAELFHFCDNLSAATYATYFDELAAEYYRKRARELREGQKSCAVHLDGTIRGLLGRLAATGVGGVEALTTAPVGDVAASALRGLAGNPHTVLWGCLPAGMFTSDYPRKELVRTVGDLIAMAKEDGFIIAGSADQIPPHAELDRISLVADMIGESY